MVKNLIGSAALIFFLNSCTDSVNNVSSIETKVDNKVHNSIISSKDIKIAFYHQDSMKIYFKYYKEQDSIFSVKQLSFQNKIGQKRKKMEDYYMNFMRRVQNNELSQIESESYQRNLQNQESELMQYQETEGGKLEKETLLKYDEISKKINNFSEDFCEIKNIDILLVHAIGGQFNFISDKLNVTEDFVNFLNKSQLSIENELSK